MDGFGPVSAGPPEPGKMDMLPHGHHPPPSSSSSYHQNTQQQQQQQHVPYTAAQKLKARAPQNPSPYPGHIEDYQPVAPTSGRTNITKGSSTTSEFTKRKNWSQRIVEEMQDVLHVLSPSGVFLFVSPSILEITGYTPEELVGKGITEFIEKDDVDTFIKDFSAAIHQDTPLTTYFRFTRKDERAVLFEVTGQAYYTQEPSTSSNNNSTGSSESDAAMRTKQPPSASSTKTSTKTCKCLFAMARLYPSKNNAMLDSFLELKVENEKLRQKLSEVYAEIEGEGIADANNSSSGTSGTFSNLHHNGSGGMEFTLGGSGSGIGDNRQVAGYPSRMSGVFAAQNAAAQSSASGMASGTGNSNNAQQQEDYKPFGQDGSNSADQAGGARGTQINQDNVLVSSAGLIPSTSNTYGALGIGISSANARAQAAAATAAATGASAPSGVSENTSHMPAGAAGGGGGQGAGAGAGDAGLTDAEKKKKIKKARTDEGEFVCRDCGTVDSPEWRRGPLGPKTLCNAVSIPLFPEYVLCET